MLFAINVKIYRAQLIHLEISHWIYPPPHPPTHQIIPHLTRNHIQYISMIASKNSLARKSLEIFQKFIASMYFKKIINISEFKAMWQKSRKYETADNKSVTVCHVFPFKTIWTSTEWNQKQNSNTCYIPWKLGYGLKLKPNSFRPIIKRGAPSWLLSFLYCSYAKLDQTAIGKKHHTFKLIQ